MNQMGKYDDIINLQRPDIYNHQRASREARAAQFGAFRALTGYEEAIYETARITDNEAEISEAMIEIINGKLKIIEENICDENKVTITYFVPDISKSGGKYIKYSGIVKKIDEFERKIVFKDKTQIQIDRIVEIDCDKF